jgi:quinol-cytochrome oxidoreductase complex cytochrome b subunit
MHFLVLSILCETSTTVGLRYTHAMEHQFSLSLYYTHTYLEDSLRLLLSAREALWCSGVVILLFMILTAFLGYITLGTNEFTGRHCYTNLASTIPQIGDILVLVMGRFQCS